MESKWFCVGSIAQALELFPDMPDLLRSCREMFGEGCPSLVVCLCTADGHERHPLKWTLNAAENRICSPSCEVCPTAHVVEKRVRALMSGRMTGREFEAEMNTDKAQLSALGKGK